MREAKQGARAGAQVVQQQARPAVGAAYPLRDSPRLVAQRERIDAVFGAVAQKAGALEDEEPLQARMEDAAPRNETGMPNQLKAGIEALSGMDMSDVRVHRNSDKPAQLNALAYAQGNDIHLGAGQEQHLPHEAWHVVQQRQGRVQATQQMGAGGTRQDPAPTNAAGGVVQRKLADVWLAMSSSAYRNKGFAKTFGPVPDEVCEALNAYVQAPDGHDAQELSEVHGAVSRWLELELELSREAPQGPDAPVRFPRERIRQLLFDIERERSPQDRPSTYEWGFSSVGAAFAALKVSATNYVPDNATRSKPVGGPATANSVYEIQYGGRAGHLFGYFKAEKDALSASERGAAHFGVPKQRPALSARSVATHRIAQSLGLDVIPETYYAVHLIDARYFPGVVMRGVATETVDQRAKGGKFEETDPGRRGEYRRRLSILQLFDLLTGQTDRHQGNIKMKDGQVHGIDNDLAFGIADNLAVPQDMVEMFAKVNTLEPDHVLADATFAQTLIALAGNAGGIAACKDIIAAELGMAEADAFAARLRSLAVMLSARQEQSRLVPSDKWAETPSKYAKVIPNVGSVPAPF